MDSGPRLDEGPVKKVAVVGHEDVGADLQNVVEPSLEMEQSIISIKTPSLETRISAMDIGFYMACGYLKLQVLGFFSRTNGSWAKKLVHGKFIL